MVAETDLILIKSQVAHGTRAGNEVTEGWTMSWEALGQAEVRPGCPPEAGHAYPGPQSFI